MRIIAFSDLHAHPHRFGAVIDQDTGRSNRLQHALDVLHATAHWASSSGAALRLFAGDLFHERGRLRPSVLNPVVEHYRSVHASGAGQFIDVLIPGNHDEEARSDGEHALGALKGLPGVIVLDGSGYKEIDVRGVGVGIGWVCHTPNVEDMRARVRQVEALRRSSAGQPTLSIFMMHHGVDGAMAGLPDCGFAVGHLPFDDFDYILCGDYHGHKELIPGKAWMIGAPIHHNFGDAGQERGFMVIDTDTMSHCLVPLSNVPRFVAIDATGGRAVDMAPAKIGGNFVRIRADDQMTLDGLAEMARGAGALAVQGEVAADVEAIQRADMTLSMTVGQMFAAWTEKQGIDPAEVAELVVLNAEVLAEAGVV